MGFKPIPALVCSGLLRASFGARGSGVQLKTTTWLLSPHLEHFCLDPDVGEVRELEGESIPRGGRVRGWEASKYLKSFKSKREDGTERDHEKKL